MALSSFLSVNGVDFPCPRDGFSYVYATSVDSGRNANNAVVGQIVGREVIKLDNMEWVGLRPEEWQRMLDALEPFFVDVTFEDYKTGLPKTVKMYHGDITAVPLFVDKETHKVIQYRSCKVNLIDCGL